MKNVISMDQVHGDNIQIVSSQDIGKTIPKCDGLITDDMNINLCVRVADCLPVTIKDINNRAIGIFHAGWKGLDKNILQKAVEIFESEFSISPRDLAILVGPHICRHHYEVKSDVSSRFSEYPKAILKKGSKETLDLAEIAREQMILTGVLDENITIDKRCTFEDERLSSFRRDKSDKRNYYFCSL